MTESSLERAAVADSTADEQDDGNDQSGSSDTDWQAEAERWKTESRKHEKRARENAAAQRELAQLRQSSLSDSEKAAAEAEQRGRAAAAAEFGQRLASAEIRAALTGIVDNPASLVEDLNLVKYVTDDGEVDAQAVKALKDKYSTLFGNGRKTPAVSHGRTGNNNSVRTPADDFAATLNGLLGH